MIRRIEGPERRARLGRRHHLAVPAAGIVQVAGDLVGLHSSDPATVYLSARARIGGFRPVDLEDALYETRSLLRLVGMRRTMFVAPLEVAAEMSAACAIAYAPAEHRRLAGWLAAQGIGDAAWVSDVEDQTVAALERLGEATANELRRVVPQLQAQIAFGEGKTYAGTVGVSTRILFLLAARGKIIRTRPGGTWVSTQYRWARMEDWIEGGLPDIDPVEAAARMARRWLAGFGPGTEGDLAWWTGWGLGKTRAALEAVDAVEVDLDGVPGWVLPDDLDTVDAPDPWVALLPGLDPTTMGWKQRDWYLGDRAPGLFDRNGNAGPTVWVDGRVVGAWAQLPSGEIVFELLEPVGAETRRAIESEATRLRDWLGHLRVKPRFPTPVETRLRS